MKICPICNKEFNDDASFCNNDGTKLVTKSTVVEHTEKEVKEKKKGTCIPEKTFALITNIFIIAISVLTIASFFGDWIGFFFFSGQSEGIPELSGQGYDSGNIINIINILIKGEAGQMLTAISVVSLILMIVFFALSIFQILAAIKSISTGKLEKNQKIALFVFSSLVILTGSFINSSNQIINLLYFFTFVYIVLYTIQRILLTGGKLSKTLFAIAVFSLFLGILFGISATTEIPYEIESGIDYSYVYTYQKSSLFGFLYILTCIEHGYYAGEIVKGIYYYTFVMYILSTIVMMVLFFLLAFKKYDIAKFVGFGECLILIVWMIGSALLEQHTLELGMQITSLVFTSIGTILLTTSQNLVKKEEKNIVQ